MSDAVSIVVALLAGLEAVTNLVGVFDGEDELVSSRIFSEELPGTVTDGWDTPEKVLPTLFVEPVSRGSEMRSVVARRELLLTAYGTSPDAAHDTLEAARAALEGTRSHVVGQYRVSGAVQVGDAEIGFEAETDWPMARGTFRMVIINTQ